MKSTFHNSYVILDLVLNTGIFWIELSCGGENWSKKMIKILILDWSHRSQNHLRSSSGSGWPPGNIHFQITMNLFLFTYNVFFSSIIDNTLLDLTLYMNNTASVLKERELLTLRVHMSSPTDFDWVFFRTLFSLFCCVICLCIACLCPVSCVPNVTSFTGLSIRHCPFGFL
jgi:hypothetical protein